MEDLGSGSPSSKLCLFTLGLGHNTYSFWAALPSPVHWHVNCLPVLARGNGEPAWSRVLQAEAGRRGAREGFHAEGDPGFIPITYWEPDPVPGNRDLETLTKEARQTGGALCPPQQGFGTCARSGRGREPRREAGGLL